MRHFILANIAAALAQSIFGVGQVVVKIGMSANMSPLLLSLVRVSLSGLLFLIFAAITKAKLRIRCSDIPRFLLVSFRRLILLSYSGLRITLSLRS